MITNNSMKRSRLFISLSLYLIVASYWNDQNPNHRMQWIPTENINKFMGKSINAKKYDTQPLENPREKKNNGGKS